MNISIPNPPGGLMERLKRQARSHNRTPEAEALAILESALGSTEMGRGPAAVSERIRKLGLSTPSESVEIIRAFRDSQSR